MRSRVSRRGAEIRQRHYVRNATSQNRWFDFTASGISDYRSRFGDDFCLIVNGSHSSDDAFIIPYAVAKEIFTTPALDRRGQLVGVNVATSGGGIGYLVPAHFLQALLADLPTQESRKPVEVVGEQLLAEQERFYAQLLAQPWKTEAFFDLQMPDAIHHTIKCWGESNDEKNRRDGLRLPDDTLADLARVAKLTGLESRLPF